MQSIGLIGTYKNEKNDGIYYFTLDPETGALKLGNCAAGLSDSKYLAIHGNLLASSFRVGDGDESYSGIALMQILQDKSGHPRLEEAARITEGKMAACYLIFTDKYLVSSNYHEGKVHFYEYDAHFLKRVKTFEFGLGAGAHQVIVRNGYFYVPCLAQDKVQCISLELEFLGACEFPKGSGPRHGILSEDECRLYLVSELSNELFTCSFAEGPIPKIESNVKISAFAGAHPAAIRRSSGNVLYLTVREENILSIWDVGNGISPAERIEDGQGGSWADRQEDVTSDRQTEVTADHQTDNVANPRFLQGYDVKGDHPRDMILTPDEKFVLIANKESGSLVSYRIDAKSPDRLEYCDRIEIEQGVALMMLPE